MGVKRTGDLLEKLTWGFAIGLIVLALATHVIGGGSNGPARSVNQQAAQNAKVNAPAAPVAPTSAPATQPITAPQPAK
jgi:preprotein translocase subunit SecG